MFEWLDDEIARIKTRKFHLVDGPASDELRRAIETTEIPLPPSYKQFALRFGNAKLYRYSTSYYVTVFAGPRAAEDRHGELLVHIGRTWTSHAYFKDALLVQGEESPVFEYFNNCIRKTADGFGEWLEKKGRSVRRRFKKKEWEAIVNGPPPFTEEELAIVEARSQFRWRLVGVVPNENLSFEIHNGSSRTLPYLSVGVRGKRRPPLCDPLDGGVYLPVASIRPGETRIVEHDCYKEYVTPEDTEVFGLPEPGPEDREEYWEFRTC